MWIALSAIPRARSPFPPRARMSAERIEQVVAAIANAVEDAELTVDELTDAIAARVGDRVMEACQDKWPRWRQAESIATDRGVMCFGPDRGRRSTYTSPRRRLPGFWPAPVKKALAALVRRYLHAYGPAPDWAAGLFARGPSGSG
jgi:hypothetical protein